MKRYLTILFILLSTSLFANKLDSSVVRANDSFSQGNYSEAVGFYESVIDSDIESFELYFNLGNAYFKKDDLPSALLNYEKAKKLNPRDKDLLFNINVANSRIQDKIEVLPRLFFVNWWIDFRNIMNTDQWAWMLVLSFILLLLLLIFFLFSRNILLKKFSFYSGLIVFTIVAISTIMSIQQYKRTNLTTAAIVFTPSVTIKSSPNEDGNDLFVIHEGLKVIVIDEVSPWYRIKIADGNDGWIHAEDLKII